MPSPGTIAISSVENTVIQGDSIEFMRRLPDASGDMIFAGPP